ncbi:MAG: SPFH domain-containing protein [Oscillospiraceae bacterium]
MGLLQAGIGALSGALGDTWRDYFQCESMPNDLLVVKGRKKVTKGSNRNGSDDIISNGSIIEVADGQCALLVDNGKVCEVCADPGQFVWDSSTEPSLFYGNLGDSIKATFASIGNRFAFGGDAPKTMRVYYVNTKEIMGSKYGTTNPISFRVLDRNIGLDLDTQLKINGEYSYRIVNPILFYTNVCGNVADSYSRTTLDPTLKSEILTAMQPALGKFSDMGIRPSGLPSHAMEITDALNEVLSKKWGEQRGITIVNFNMNPPAIPKEDQEMITQLQRTAVFRDPSMGAANMNAASADAMRIAAGNAGGAAMGFYNMGMAQQAGGMNQSNLYNMAAQQQAMQAQQAQMNQPAPAAPAAGAWKCSCGTQNTGKFCANCGSPKPADNFWTCSCGGQNQGKFCQHCGKPKPAGVPQYKCDKCGWTPEDPTNPPKFCPECGDPFDANDLT